MALRNPIENEIPKLFEVMNSSGDAEREETHVGKTDGILFGSDRRKVFEILQVSFAETVVVSETSADRDVHSRSFEQSEKSVRFCDPGESGNRAAGPFIDLQRLSITDESLNEGCGFKGRNGQIDFGRSQNRLYTGGVSSFDRRPELAPRSGRKNLIFLIPLDWIDRDDINIAVKATVLKPIVEQKEIAQLLVFGRETSLISPFSNDNRDRGQSPCDQLRFVARFQPINLRTCSTTDDDDTPAPSFIAS